VWGIGGVSMHFRSAITAAALVLLGAASPSRGAPLEAYGQLPTIEQVVLSPDGGKIAYIRHGPGGDGVVAASLSPVEQLAGLNYGQEKLREVIWADPTHLLVVRSVATKPFANWSKSEWSLLDCVDLVTHKVTQPMRSSSAGLYAIVGEPQVRAIDGHAKVFVEGVAFYGAAVKALYSIDVATMEVSPVRDVGLNAGQWVIDASGKVLAETHYSESSHNWQLWLEGEYRPEKAKSIQATIDEPVVQGLSPDGSSVILSMVQDGDITFRPASLKDGALGVPIQAYKDVSGLIQDPKSRRIIGGVKVGTGTSYIFFDPKDQAAWDELVRRFPDEDVQLVSWSDDRSRVVLRVTGQVHGVAYLVVDPKTQTVTKVGQVYAGLKADDLAGVEAIEYRAADGRKIPAYLTLPNGRDAKQLPLVVLPHGGPADIDGPGFDWWSQALASRGYAVLQPQFRGSAELGWEFVAAGFGEWGRKMQTDLSDGVRALAASGIVDPKRVCIVGGSYGGYAALAGPTLDPGVYRCAVSVAGISDMRRMLSWEQDRGGARDTPSVRYWDRFTGAKGPDDPVLQTISPIRHLDRDTIPILLIHGKDDTVVPIEQSQMMSDALRAAGKPVEFVVLPVEDHWLSRSETRLQMLQSTVKFLEANNPPG
jgi:acetyl esterase/lipase